MSAPDPRVVDEWLHLVAMVESAVAEPAPGQMEPWASRLGHMGALAAGLPPVMSPAANAALFSMATTLKWAVQAWVRMDDEGRAALLEPMQRWAFRLRAMIAPYASARGVPVPVAPPLPPRADIDG
jgi:hypothetical protein